MKIIMFGQIAVAAFSKTEQTDYDYFNVSEDSIIARGLLSKLTDKQAHKFCPLHPNFMKYYEHAMMALWKGKGIYKNGTECAVNAVKSHLPENTQFYIAWRPLV